MGNVTCNEAGFIAGNACDSVNFAFWSNNVFVIGLVMGTLISVFTIIWTYY